MAVTRVRHEETHVVDGSSALWNCVLVVHLSVGGHCDLFDDGRNRRRRRCSEGRLINLLSALDTRCFRRRGSIACLLAVAGLDEL